MVSVLGGKWTTYRKIAEDAVNTIQLVGGLSERKCETDTLPIFGFDYNSDWSNPFHCYGTEIQKLINSNPKTAKQSLSSKVHITENQIRWAVREEMAIHLEDVLARRTRCLFLDAYETEKIAPKVASIMADELDADASWIKKELNLFSSLLKNYQI
ncbi:MAG: glycerol-3-phosphate dehydrogenase C-terminal domain-containing protein [Flavobacteriaceae bacterium]